MARSPTGITPPGGMVADPTAGAAGGPAGADAGPDDTDAGEGDDEGVVVVTISKQSDGSYMVYAGDEPDDAGGGADMSEDDADAGATAGGAAGGAAGGGGMGGGMGAGASQGQPADSIGAALKIAMDILQGDASSEGAPGSADDQFQAGFSSDQSPTPVRGASARR
jgi:hypothetical protein